MLKYIMLIFLLSLFSSQSFADLNRFEELFIWKMSEALELDAQQEAKFSDTIRGLNAKKAKALDKLNKVNAKLGQVKDEVEAKQVVADYEAALRVYQDINYEEVEELKKIFNRKALAKYLSYKAEVLKKLQSQLNKRAKDGKTRLNKGP